MEIYKNDIEHYEKEIEDDDAIIKSLKLDIEEQKLIIKKIELRIYKILKSIEERRIIICEFKSKQEAQKIKNIEEGLTNCFRIQENQN